jgi:hypothetical protein
MNNSRLSNTMYDILKVMGKDAEFLYDTIDTYIQDAQNANKQELVDTWKKNKDWQIKSCKHAKRRFRRKSITSNNRIELIIYF